MGVESLDREHPVSVWDLTDDTKGETMEGQATDSERQNESLKNAARPQPADAMGRNAASNADLPSRFYAVSLSKILILGICSLGLYGLYWMYRQWRAYQESLELDQAAQISPTGRALFAIFFIHELFRKIRMETHAVSHPGTLPHIEGASSFMATLWIVLSILVRVIGESDRLPFGASHSASSVGSGGLPALLLMSVLPLLPILSAQKEINRTHLCIRPTNQIERRYSAIGGLTIIVGTLFLGATSILSAPAVQRHLYLRNSINACMDALIKKGALADAASGLCACIYAEMVKDKDPATLEALSHRQEQWKPLQLAAVSACQQKYTGPEWRPRIPKPNVPVLRRDYQLVGPSSPESANPKEVEAERLKFSGRLEEAESLFRQLLSEHPDRADVAYQLACTSSSQQKYEAALQMLGQAVHLGFAEYPVARFDDELTPLTQSPRFMKMLAEIRDRYAAGMPPVGTPVVFLPLPTRDAQQRPLILLLHGFGDTHESYFEQAEQWAGLGFVAVAVPGSLPLRKNAFIWSQDDIETTHAQLQAIVNSPIVAREIDPKRVFLLGFSQGALHALQVAAKYSSKYAGVISLSPGGMPWLFGEEPSSIAKGAQLRAVLVSGVGELKAQQELIPHLNQLMQSAGWSTLVLSHDGAHHFPTDWVEHVPRLAAFLLGRDSTEIQPRTSIPKLTETPSLDSRPTKK